METSHYILLACLLGLTVLHIRLYRRYRRNIRKVKFMFDAIDNIDYAFRFPTDEGNNSDNLMNISLNRIKQILQNARNEALEREKYYEQIINAVDTGIMIVDEHGHVLQHNQAILQLLGTDVLTNLNQVGDKMDSERMAKKETHAQLRGKDVRIIAVSDITGEISKAELDSWTKLIRVLTHEIMNTVTPIMSLSETLLNRIDSPERAMSLDDLREGLATINKTSNELIAFVENYRRLTRVPTPTPALFYVRPFLERMVRLAESLSHGQDVALHIDMDTDDLILLADETLIAHVVTNILKNALQSIEGEGNIWLKAWCDDKEAVIIDITNDGPLIPDDVASHIFVPFFTTKKDGSGIGLSLSRQIMRQSGGTLALLTNRQQGLTTFRLLFP